MKLGHYPVQSNLWKLYTPQPLFRLIQKKMAQTVGQTHLPNQLLRAIAGMAALYTPPPLHSRFCYKLCQFLLGQFKWWIGGRGYKASRGLILRDSAKKFVLTIYWTIIEQKRRDYRGVFLYIELLLLAREILLYQWFVR